VSDRSLDEFATPSETAADEKTGADADATPATPTMRWAADAVCSACGSSAPRRWRDGDAFVCADCKDW
jgi:hypothetical protein